MACDATLGLDHVVLVDKWACGLGVALGADRILLRARLQALLVERPVGIVAIGALDESLFHFVMEGHVELRPGIGVALEAELRLRNLEQVLLVFAGVYAMAAYTADIGLAVTGALKVGVLTLVASQAACIHFLGIGFGGVEYFGNVTAAIHVRLARSVAVLAGDAVLAVRESEPAVGVGGETLAHFFVACGAGFGSYKLRSSRVLGLRASRLCGWRWSRLSVGAKHECAKNEDETSSQPRRLARNRTIRHLCHWLDFVHEKIPPYVISCPSGTAALAYGQVTKKTTENA
jgi:hypothetical protein